MRIIESWTARTFNIHYKFPTCVPQHSNLRAEDVTGLWSSHPPICVWAQIAADSPDNTISPVPTPDLCVKVRSMKEKENTMKEQKTELVIW